MKVTRKFGCLFFFAVLSSVPAQAQFGSGYEAGSDTSLVEVGYTPIDSATTLASSDSENYTVLENSVSEEQTEDIVRRMLDEQKAIAAPAKEAAPTKTFPDMKMTGFFQLDTARFGQSANNIATLGDIQDGTGFRRARLAATGSVTENTTYMFEFDIAQAQARFVDVWGQFNKTPLGNVRIGRFRQPFGMSELTGIRELPFLERPVTFALVPFRQTGIMLFDTALDQRATWAFSGFRTLSDNFGNVYGDNGGYGTSERITFLPVDCGDDALIHLGLDHTYFDPARGLLQYASQDEVFVGQNQAFPPNSFSSLPITGVPPFVNTGVIAVDHANLFNIEAAASVGRALVQSEVRWSRVNLASGDTQTVPAAYITGRYMLTGEIIPYNRTGGVFGRVIPNCPVDLCKGHYGAWELATQISHIDLNRLGGLPTIDPLTDLPTGGNGAGRRLTNYTLGLNWYLNARSKIAADYIYSDLSDRVRGGSSANTYAGMVQFDF